LRSNRFEERGNDKNKHALLKDSLHVRVGLLLEQDSRSSKKHLMSCDENQYAPLKDPLHVPVEPITRARFKKMKKALNGLIQEI